MSPNRLILVALAVIGYFFLPSCESTDNRNRLVVSVQQQRMGLYQDGRFISAFPISTSKFGLGDVPNSNFTPMGRLRIADKIGAGAPLGMKFVDRRPTGEIVMPNTPGRDPIVTRILWLEGMEQQNSQAHGRYIYIHGTPEEAFLGRPRSYGCVRMASRDIAWLFDVVGKGARVDIIPAGLPEQVY